MNSSITLAGLALAAATSLFALVSLTEPASAADPVCVSGFQTVQKKSWILKCSKTVPIALKGTALTQAYNANCNTNAYWNFGPAVTATTPMPGFSKVSYTCGHVEG